MQLSDTGGMMTISSSCLTRSSRLASCFKLTLSACSSHPRSLVLPASFCRPVCFFLSSCLLLSVCFILSHQQL